MNFECQLKELIKKKYGSVRAFSQIINMPYSTIDNIFKRGIMGVSIQVVLRICSELSIDIEQIQKDKLVLKEHIDEKLKEIYTLYTQLDAEDRAEIRGEMKHMLKADKYKKASSIQTVIKETLIDQINSAVKNNTHHV